MKISAATSPTPDAPLVLLANDLLGLPPALQNALRARLQRGPVAVVPTLGLYPASSIIAVTEPDWHSPLAIRRRGGAIARVLMAEQAAQATLRLPDGLSEQARAGLLLGLRQGSYAFDRYLPKKATRLGKLHLLGSVPSTALLNAVHILGAELDRARDLTNTPASDMGPDELEAECRAVAKAHGLRITVHDEAACHKLGLGALLAVGRASPRRPRLVVLEWPGRSARKAKGKSTAKPLALCGKGVTFDTGGLDIKPANAMELMRKDMGGAAVVLGVISAVAQLNGSQPLRAYLPLVENSIAGDAFRPGDVLTAMDGTTIEIGNTDAEGRLILADALCLARSEGASQLVTVATLTGAALVALGRIHVPLMGSDDTLQLAIEAAAQRAGEKVWRLPMDNEHRDLIKSSNAQLNNAGPGEAGCITAGSFLAHFAGDTPFAHLDISPCSWLLKPHDLGPAGATGVMLTTLVNLALGDV